MKNRAPYGCPAKLDFNWRKRRGLVAHQRYGEGYIIIAEPPEVARVGRSGKAEVTGRDRQIDPAMRERIVKMAGAGRTLREISAEVGRSHEWVRGVLR